MQLISLWVEDFKNLKDFTINFENQENLSIIIGNNGSGKSNILEAISAIFAELYGKTSYIANYNLKYRINGHFVEIKKTTERVPLPFGNQSTGSAWRLPVTEFKVDTVVRSKKYLTDNNLAPSRIVALYSGEETRLYTRYYEAFTKKYLRDFSKLLSPSNSMIYIDRSYWNIALLALILSAEDGNMDHKNFLENELHVKTIHKIRIYFKTSYFRRIIPNSPLDVFLGIINFDKKRSVDYINNSLFLALNPKYNNRGIDEIFNILLHATLLQRAKVFENIEFTINDDKISLNDLSEGEKKKLLIKVAMDFVANENSLVLFDEPDAHIHIAGKQDIFNLFKDYASFQRSIVITTHSPTLTNCADDKHIIMLDKDENDYVSIFSQSKKDLIQKLTGDIYGVAEQKIIFNSTIPLVLVEGKSDIKYIRRALEKFSQYRKNYDILSFNGTGNAQSFYDDLKPVLMGRKVIVILDRDHAGISALGKFISQQTKDEKWKDFLKDTNIYFKKSENLYVFLLPQTDEYKNENSFLIEDYFSAECKLRILNDKITKEGKTLKSFEGVEKHVKSYLEKNLSTDNEESMDNFTLLLDKIQEVVDGTSIQNLVEVP